MPKYLIASLRGKDFEIEGNDPEDALANLVEREFYNGSLWKTSDPLRNKTAVIKQGFTFSDPTNHTSFVWKLVK